MGLFHHIAVLLTCVIYATLAIRIGRGLGPPVDPVSSISSPLYRHTGYIDQKVRGKAYTSLNHESYHLRNVATVPARSWNASMGPSNITSDSIVVDESFILPDSDQSNSSTNASSSSNTTRLTDIPLLFQSTEALATSSDADATWNNQTDAACTIALSALNGVATNPSGIAACYNIRNFNKSNGLFLADLRLFRIGAPAVNFTRLVVSSETLDVNYASASIASRDSMWKRDITPGNLAGGRIAAKDVYLRRNTIGRPDKPKREITAIALPPIQAEEAKDMYLRRTNGAPPKMLQGLTFTAAYGGNFSDLTMNRTIVYSILLPKITFSGATTDGMVLSIQLSAYDASFVYGLFTQYSTMNMTSRVLKNDAQDSALLGTTLAIFPIGLIITIVWTLLLLMVMGYGAVSKKQARDAYRRRVRSRMSGGIGRLYTSSELEALSKNVQAWM